MEMVVKGAAAAEGAVAKMKPGMTVICQRKGTEELFLATEHVVMWRVSVSLCLPRQISTRLRLAFLFKSTNPRGTLQII